MDVSVPEKVFTALAVLRGETLVPGKTFFPTLIATVTKNVDAKPTGLTYVFRST